MNKIALVIVVLIGIILGPLLFIWSVNTLFLLNIPYGFFEWLAAMFIVGTLSRYKQ